MTNFNDIIITDNNTVVYRPEIEKIIQIWYETGDIAMFTWYCQRQGFWSVMYGSDDIDYKGKEE